MNKNNHKEIKHAPEMVQHLYTIIKDHYLKRAANDEMAHEVALESCKTLCQHFGGELVYIPKAIVWKLSERDREIYEKFNGHNQRELAKEYGVSVIWIYSLIKRVKKEVLKEQQNTLF